uniref:Uncharacterized protein n=1 Tax=Cannabis sativa TaxID=3483 RepID=A0A803QAE6_CANSA
MLGATLVTAGAAAAVEEIRLVYRMCHRQFWCENGDLKLQMMRPGERVDEERQFLLAGVRKSIARGFETSILDDPWLPDGIDPYVRSVNPGLVNKKNDYWTWSREKTGVYSVKSAYRGMQEHSIVSGMPTEFWSAFWKINVQPKIEEALMVTWAIWNARNQLLWNQKSTVALDVVLSARSNLYQWQSAQQNRFDPLLSSFEIGKEVEHWTKPVGNKIKVNVDGAIFEAYNSFGFGFSSDTFGCSWSSLPQANQ